MICLNTNLPLLTRMAFALVVQTLKRALERLKYSK